MRITGYRTLTTIQEWARPVGDANGVFADGVTTVPMVMVDTDEGITGVGLGPHVELDSVFAAIEGEDPRSVTALYDRMLRHDLQGGPRRRGVRDHRRARHRPVGHQGAGGRTNRSGVCWAAATGRVPAYASGLDIGLADDELVAVYEVYAEHGLRAAKLKGGLDIEQDRRRLTAGTGRADRGRARNAAGPDARRERGLVAQAGRPARPRARTHPGPHLGRGARAALGRRGPGRGPARRSARRWPPGRTSPGSSSSARCSQAGGVDIVQTAAVWGITHFLRVAALAHAHDLPVSPIGNIPVGLLHAATAVPNHMASELQDLRPPVGVSARPHVEDGAFVLGDSPGLGITVDEGVIAELGPAGPRRPRRAGHPARARRTAAARDRAGPRPDRSLTGRSAGGPRGTARRPAGPATTYR